MPKPSPDPARSPSKGPSAGSRPASGLGRGLSEIIAQGARPPSSPTAPASVGTHIRSIPLSQIVPNPKQPRLHFVKESLDELVASIREHGVLQPITVRPHDHHFEIIAGERRFRACQKAGLPAIPAIVRAVSDMEAYELALVENLQREDLDPIEEACGYRRLADDFTLTQEQIAQKVGKNRATVANAIRLLELPEEVLGYLSQNRISTGHAKAILGLSQGEHQIRVAQEVIKQGLSVRQTELWVSRFRSPSEKSRKKGPVSGTAAETPAHLRAIRDALQQKLATRIHIREAGNGGTLEIQYYTPSDLDRLLQMFQIQL